VLMRMRPFKIALLNFTLDRWHEFQIWSWRHEPAWQRRADPRRRLRDAHGGGLMLPPSPPLRIPLNVFGRDFLPVERQKAR
jgi:hypothetical protein